MHLYTKALELPLKPQLLDKIVYFLFSPCFNSHGMHDAILCEQLGEDLISITLKQIGDIKCQKVMEPGPRARGRERVGDSDAVGAGVDRIPAGKGARAVRGGGGKDSAGVPDRDGIKVRAKDGHTAREEIETNRQKAL